MKFSTFQTDRTLEEQGVEVEIGKGATITVARIGNSKYETLLRAMTKPFRRQIQQGLFPIERQDELLLEVVSKTVLLGWKGFTDDDEKEIPFSPAKALELMTETKDFRDLVFEIANEMETFRRVEQEEDSKNSKAS